MEVSEARTPSRRAIIAFRWQRAPLKERLKREGLLVALMVVIVGLSRWLTPSPTLIGTHRQLLLPPCGMYVLTGRPCPACGATSSFALMAHGRFATAFHAHLLAPFLFAGLVVSGVFAGVCLIAGRQLHVEMAGWLRNVLTGVIVAVFAIYGVVRFIVWKG